MAPRAIINYCLAIEAAVALLPNEALTGTSITTINFNLGRDALFVRVSGPARGASTNRPPTRVVARSVDPAGADRKGALSAIVDYFPAFVLIGYVVIPAGDPAAAGAAPSAPVAKVTVERVATVAIVQTTAGRWVGRLSARSGIIFSTSKGGSIALQSGRLLAAGVQAIAIISPLALLVEAPTVISGAAEDAAVPFGVAPPF